MGAPVEARVEVEDPGDLPVADTRIRLGSLASIATCRYELTSCGGAIAYPLLCDVDGRGFVGKIFRGPSPSPADHRVEETMSTTTTSAETTVRYICETEGHTGDTGEAVLGELPGDTYCLDVVAAKKQLQPSASPRLWIRQSVAYHSGRYKLLQLFFFLPQDRVLQVSFRIYAF